MTQAADVLTAWDLSLDLIRTRGYERRDEPFKLASGQWSHDYIDGKYTVDHGERLRIVSTAIVEVARVKTIAFTHVGGRTMGADPLATGISIVAGCGWFSVRKEPKPRGREQWIEGSRLQVGDTVLLVDDVVTTGGSILQAYDHVLETGARVTGVIPMVDRGDMAAALFADLGIPYAALVTYKDLGIDPVEPA
jgi:orotate phosphoribosyltransferase